MRSLRLAVSPVNILCRWTTLTLLCAWAQDFGYGPQHGPEYWSETIRCSGKYQMSVDFGKVKVHNRNYPELEYKYFDRKPYAVHMINNGYTILVTMSFDKDREPCVWGGPLQSNATYQFEQFHFRWSDNETIFNRNHSQSIDAPPQSPAELHVVMRSREYPDFESAVGQNNGIIVLAYFFKIQEMDNIFYNGLVEMLPNISQKDSSVDLEKPLPLMRFISSDAHHYYSYGGSLTTAPCIEQVIWIDFFQPIGLSEVQFDYFRKLIVNDEHLKYSSRPTELPGDRVIYTNIFSYIDMGTDPRSTAHAGPVNTSRSIRLAGTTVPLGVIAWLCLLLLLKGNLLVAFN